MNWAREESGDLGGGKLGRNDQLNKHPQWLVAIDLHGALD